MSDSTRQQESNNKKRTLLQNWVFKMLHESFSKMEQGQLTLHLPSGEVFQYGQTLTSISDAEIIIHDNRFFDRLLMQGHIGFGESFVAGEWTSPSPALVIAWFILNYEHSPILEGASGKRVLFNLLGLLDRVQHMLRHNSVENSSKNIREHYDLSNDFFKLFLDPTMAYSSGIYRTPEDTLETAQRQKFEALVKKLRLKQTDHVLEIGTGWGGFAIYMAQTTGCKVTTITISNAQFQEAKMRIEQAGLSHLIDLQLIDYRKIKGQFDKIVSVEMIEAVGDKYLDTYLKVCTDLLKPHGLLVLQMIACPDCRYDILRRHVDFIQKHIFPGTLLPSLERLQHGLRRAGDLGLFEIEDIGLSYAKTLREWLNRFQANNAEVLKLGFDEKFVRTWQYYLEYCEAAFASRNITDVQAVYTRPNNMTLFTEQEMS